MHSQRRLTLLFGAVEAAWLALLVTLAFALFAPARAQEPVAAPETATAPTDEPSALLAKLVRPQLTLVWQDGTSHSRTLYPGWSHLVGPLGAHLFAEDGRFCLRLSNGVVDAPGEVGTTFLARIEIDTGFSLPVIIERAGWKVTGSKLVIGDGRECIPPRGSLRIRWALPGVSVASAPPSDWTFHVGSLEIPLPESLAHRDGWRVARLLEALRSGKPDPDGARLHTPALGLWHPRGDPYCAVGGAHGIEPISGWERSWHLSVLASDLTMERMPLDALRASDGEPVVPGALDSSNYALVRGWSKSGQLPRFARVASSMPYDDGRLPKSWNVGECAYFAQIHGLDRYSGFLPHDGQHLIRGVHEADAGAQLWGDACCAFDLRVIAADVRYAYRSLAPVATGQGSAWYGRREAAWAAWTLLAADATDPVAIALLARAEQAQMPNGFVLRLNSDNGVLGGNWALVPNPWTGDGNVSIPKVLPPLYDAAQTMEQHFTVHAWTRGSFGIAALKGAGLYLPTGRGGRAAPSFIERFGYCPKYVGVADLHGAPHRSIVYGAGIGDYFGLLVPGLMGCRALQLGEDPKPWRDALMRMGSLTRGKAPSEAVLLDLYAKDPAGASQTVAAASFLERYSRN